LPQSGVVTLKKEKVKHKLQKGKGNFVRQKAKALLYVGYVISSR
jgi:hypothetical protein